MHNGQDALSSQSIHRYPTACIVSLLHDEMWHSFYMLRWQDNIKIVHNEEGYICRSDSCKWLTWTVFKFHRTWETSSIAEIFNYSSWIRLSVQTVQIRYEFAQNGFSNGYFVQQSHRRPFVSAVPTDKTWACFHTSKALRKRHTGFAINQRRMHLRTSSHIFYIIKLWGTVHNAILAYSSLSWFIISYNKQHSVNVLK